MSTVIHLLAHTLWFMLMYYRLTVFVTWVMYVSISSRSRRMGYVYV